MTEIHVFARVVSFYIQGSMPARYKYSIWRPGDGYWWSRKLGWLPPKRQNIKHYATFTTEQAANAVLARLLTEVDNG